MESSLCLVTSSEARGRLRRNSMVGYRLYQTPALLEANLDWSQAC